jgi:hypothetical protein
MMMTGIKRWVALCAVLLAGFGVLAAQDNTATTFEANLRADLDLLAGVVFAGELPEPWTANTDPSTANFIADLFFDNELLANAVFGDGVRPDEWFGASSPNRGLVARNLRHDLEATASFYYAGNTRPEGWAGAPAGVRCDRLTQTLILVLGRDYQTTPTTLEAVVDYCAAVRSELEDAVYSDLLQALGTQLLDPEVIGGLRGDLERLADERLGLETRPAGWIGNRDAASPTFLSDVFVDLGRLADNQLGTNVRPEGWGGVITTSPVVSARSNRVDLELLTDAVLGEGVRPRGWQGTDPLARCTPELQTVIALIEARYGSIREGLVTGEGEGEAAPIDDTAYCAQVLQLAVQNAENPPAVVTVGEDGSVDSRLLFRSRGAFSYLDVAAIQYMGPMPYDIQFRPWYRNFQDSNMMFVTGEDFAVFIDRRWTNMPEEVFRLLPNLEGRKPLTFCDATWCNGPQPTPTPTGVGPIIDILNAGTPAPTVVGPSTGPVPTGKTQVTWNNIRVGYIFDNPATQTVQVTLEICAETSQISCEPVISVFNTTTNSFKPIFQQFNGLNVFEFPYGYQTNVVIEGATRFSRDVFISEPGLRQTQPTPTPIITLTTTPTQ